MTAGLIYHDVAAAGWREEAGFPGPAAARYKLDPATFERHLDAIAATGASVGLYDAALAGHATRGRHGSGHPLRRDERPLTPREGVGSDARRRLRRPARGRAGRGRADVALTFDDGGASALDVAVLLEARGWRGHFLVTTGRIGTPGFLDADGVRELAARGHAVGAHSHTHPTLMGRLDAAEIAWEWRESRDRLAEILGAPPRLAAVPGGFLSPAVIATAAEAGFALLLTSEPVRRVARHGRLEVRGRYAIWASTPAEVAAGYARGELAPRARLWASWRAKTAAKRLSPAAYERLRHLRAG